MAVAVGGKTKIESSGRNGNEILQEKLVPRGNKVSIYFVPKAFWRKRPLAYLIYKMETQADACASMYLTVSKT
jgi:hypothetical protein